MFFIVIDKKAKIPIIRQVYQQIRDKILKSELKDGDQLPPTRELSCFLNVSRNVILEAYQMLLAEGYVISKPHKGTFVSEGAFLDKACSAQTDIPDGETAPSTSTVADLIDFRSGIPALDFLPRKKWAQMKNETYLDAPTEAFGYGEAQGRLELRKSISQYLQRTRGLYCHPDQIVITSGSIQSFSILGRLLLNDKASYIIEDPLHDEIKKVFIQTGASYHIVPADQLGIQTSSLPTDLTPQFIFVTPSHQYPLGGNLPIQRRIELIQYARLKGCYIIEDDYDSEFHYSGPPVSAMQSLEPELVIYVGSFSKILFPSVRLGYMILPYPLVKNVCEYKRRIDYFTNVVDQLTLSRFMEEMLLDKHVSRMKKLYRKRRNLLMDSLKREFQEEVSLSGESTGLHLIARFDKVHFTNELVDHLLQTGIRVHPVWAHSYDKNFPKDSIILGYSHLDETSIHTGVKRLKEGLAQFHKYPLRHT